MPRQEQTLLEAIKVQDNVIQNLEQHLMRMEHAYYQVFGVRRFFDFEPLRHEVKGLTSGLNKLRIEYSPAIFEYTFLDYKNPHINSLKLVFDDGIDYRYKYGNRSSLERLYKLKQSCDDILIVKNEHLTDSSYCNIALLQNGLWFTPTFPLLKGTKRQVLLDQDIIKERQIALTSLHEYSKIRLFNAMIDFGEIELTINKIF